MTAENFGGNSSANTTISKPQNSTATTQSNKPVTQTTLPAVTEKQLNNRGISAVTADFEDDFLRGFNEGYEDKTSYTPKQTTTQITQPSTWEESQKKLNNRGIVPVTMDFGENTKYLWSDPEWERNLRELSKRSITPVTEKFEYESSADAVSSSKSDDNTEGTGFGGSSRGGGFGTGQSGIRGGSSRGGGFGTGQSGSLGGSSRGGGFGTGQSGSLGGSGRGGGSRAEQGGSFGGNRGIFSDGTRSGGTFGGRGRGGGFGGAAMVLGLTGISGTVHNAVDKTKEQLAEEGAKLLLAGEMPDDAQLEALELDEPHARGMMVVFQMANLKDTFGGDMTELPVGQMYDFGTEENTLTNAQKSRLNTLANTINDHLKESDFSGTLRDLQGDPVPNGIGGYYNHLFEMKNSYRSLQKIRRALEGSLKNPTLSLIDRTLLQDGLNNTIFYINRIEELFDPYGGIN